MLEQILHGSWILIHGSAELFLDTGEMEIFGLKVTAPFSISVHVGKVIPAFVNGKIRLKTGFIEVINKNPFPKEWLTAIETIKKASNEKKPLIVIVIGGVDVGKSSWILYATNVLAGEGKTIGIIDADIGQAKLGPPATLKSSITNKPILFLEELPTKYLVFIGGKTPTGRLLQISAGIVYLVRKLKDVVDVILIDTTGFIFSGPARALKLAKISLIEPDFIIFFEAGKELEHLRRLLKNRYRIIHLPRPEMMKPVPREDRIKLRRFAYERFWSRAIKKKLVLNLDDIFIENAFLGSGIQLNGKAIDNSVLYAEIGPDFFLCVIKSETPTDARRKIHRRMRELWKKLSFYALAAPFSKTPPPDDIKNLCGNNLPDIIKIVQRSPPKIEIQIIPEDFYKNILVGIVGESNEDIGIGILEEIDWNKKTLTIDSALLRNEKIIGLKLGWIKLDKSFIEIGERPIGLG